MYEWQSSLFDGTIATLALYLAVCRLKTPVSFIIAGQLVLFFAITSYLGNPELIIQETRSASKWYLCQAIGEGLIGVFLYRYHGHRAIIGLYIIASAFCFTSYIFARADIWWGYGLFPYIMGICDMSKIGFMAWRIRGIAQRRHSIDISWNH